MSNPDKTHEQLLRDLGTTRLARIAEMRHCSKLELSVSIKNTARTFYERLGLSRKGDWVPYTISGAALAALAGRQ